MMAEDQHIYDDATLLDRQCQSTLCQQPSYLAESYARRCFIAVGGACLQHFWEAMQGSCHRHTHPPGPCD